MKVITIRKPWGYEEVILVDGAVLRAESLREILSPQPIQWPPSLPAEAIEFVNEMVRDAERITGVVPIRPRVIPQTVSAESVTSNAST